MNTQKDWRERFKEGKQKTFLHGGLMVISANPPHEWFLDEQSVESFIETEIQEAIARERERIRTMLEGILLIDINPSNNDQRIWYRGLGREEAQREMREKVLKSLTLNKENEV